ncbi:Alpha/Beta hydrolase protein [Colletotrichum phormii]|uniref:Alpha/Beta hydrolase protein n=1 Tax=Colletotrichum phormii TaxID=359342 RepID=A0AAI9ZGQ1_9PEZI|nr:Alpha/Beta hydrolase protein [Colletotrichum phormii]KAK1624259.1 Alpha/Beta hydrolase protein [Colletotrichum phormii]
MAPLIVNNIEVTQIPTKPPAWPSPKEPSRVELPAGSQKTPEHRPLPCDVILERDQPLTLRDGTRIRVDIFRPKTDEKVPAILMWSPYGKTDTGVMKLDAVPLRCGVPLSKLSGYESFEGLDPVEWVPKGYAIINADARGCGDSEGDMRQWGTPEGQDGHDAIEGIAKLPWCTGKVAMAGNSWLALCQWYIAAERPPHLACIAPLEGASDHMRESLCRGGIPSIEFGSMINNVVRGRGQQENTVEMLLKHGQGLRSYWDDKRARMDKIEVPAYILGSYSTMLHTVGSFRGFEEIPHQNKWMTTHATQEWFDLYSQERTDDLQQFFDRYMKGVDNGWEKTSPVRLAVLGYNKPPVIDLPFDSLPWLSPSATNTKLQRLYLGAEKTLQQSNNTNATTLSYEGTETIVFTHTFSQSTKLLGPTKLVVHVSCPSATDFDVYAQLRKRDKNGKDLEHLNIPLEALPVSDSKEIPNTNPLKYLGPNGKLRASKRKIAPELSPNYWQTLAHDEDIEVKAGEIVKMEVWIWPTAIQFDAGEQLALKITGADSLVLPEFEFLAKEPENAAAQVVHIGGEYENYLEGHWHD